MHGISVVYTHGGKGFSSPEVIVESGPGSGYPQDVVRQSESSYDGDERAGSFPRPFPVSSGAETAQSAFE